MSQIHAKTDKLSLIAVAQPDGKTRITSQSWDDAVVILPGEMLGLRWVDRQVHAIRYAGNEFPLRAPAAPDPHEDAGTDFEDSE
jgi:hypothetical protein